jgi:hypothetical protein
MASRAIKAITMTKEIMGAAEKYPNNSLIQYAFSEVIKAGTITMDKSKI